MELKMSATYSPVFSFDNCSSCMYSVFSSLFSEENGPTAGGLPNNIFILFSLEIFVIN